MHNRTLYLDKAAYRNVEKAMVRTYPQLEPATLFDVDPYRPLTESLDMLDVSLTRQMSVIAEQSTNPPDLYLFTANSAVPTSDTVRGYYAAARQAIPQLDYIAAKRAYANQIDDHDGIKRILQHPLFNEEIMRLAPIVADKQHICVVEQHSGTGKTLRYASLLLKTLGVTVVSGIRGRWYHNAITEDVDLTKVSSTHKQFMTKVGRLAWESAL